MKTLSDFYRLFPGEPAGQASAPVVRGSDSPTPVARPDRYRERSAGRGYGRSSGYAAARSYTAGREQRLLRVG